ncbi:hypothetical protein ACFL6M_02385 [Candidatus Eisenbacteria bacterium]|uniref:DUF4381 domain-containing protein n=1 Tax=Eiseniibacteriota bacterium TaxID=2212470 RepID=A0ABV6YJT5_UNCEI
MKGSRWCRFVLCLIQLCLLSAALIAHNGCDQARQADGIVWRASSTPDSVGVGDIFDLCIEGQWPDTIRAACLAWSPPGDSLIVVGLDSTEVLAAEGWTARDYRLSLLVPRAGETSIPPAALVSVHGETLAVTAASQVGTSTLADSTEQPSMRALAPMASLRDFPWRTVIVSAAILIALVAAFLWWRWRRRASLIEEGPPPIPPASEFREGLAALLAKGLQEKGHMRVFVQELSWVLRRYLGRRWEQPALEATRPEILRWLPGTELPVRDQQEVASWLETTDGIKFAGVVPVLPECERLVTRAKEMVTRGEEIEEEQERRRAQEALESAGGPRPDKTSNGRGGNA